MVKRNSESFRTSPASRIRRASRGIEGVEVPLSASYVAIPTPDTAAPPVDEAALIDAARRDRDAFGSLFERHHAAIWRYLHRRTGDAHLADDLLGEVFLALLRALPRYRVTGAPLRHWLLRVATRSANRALRQRRRRHTTPLVDVADDAPRDDTSTLRAALLQLREAEQAVLVLHYQESLSVATIAEVLGCRPGAVKSRLRRGREKLRRHLRLEER